MRLAVLAVDTADLVSAAGGLIFDSARAGWAVDAYLETICDDRALRILGVNGHALTHAFDLPPDWPDAVYLAAPLHERHRGAQRLVGGAVRWQGAHVGYWADDWTPGPSPMEHRLSSAARAFKRYALSAAGLASEVEPVEPFRSERK